MQSTLSCKYLRHVECLDFIEECDAANVNFKRRPAAACLSRHRRYVRRIECVT